MFAPIPKQNFNVYIKYRTDKADVQWTDVFNTILSNHQKNRFAGNEALLLSFSNSLRYYASSVNEKSEIEKNDNSNINYIILKKIVVQYIGYKHGELPKQLEIIIGINDVERNIKHYHYYKTSD